MKLMICGSRGITDRKVVLTAILQSGFQPTEVIHGGAKGVDQVAGAIFKSNGIEPEVYRPDYQKYGRGAPIVRNKIMVDEADAVLAIWDGRSSGTRQAIEYAVLKKKTLFVHKW